MDKLDYLIEYLLKERNQNTKKISTLSEQEKKQLFRALVNVREPKEISEDFLKIEDEYWQEELKKKEITDVEEIQTIQEKYEGIKLINSDKICFWQGDITKLKVDAIVNAGNSRGLGCFLPNHNCIDNQINTFAGVRLRLACNEVMKTKNYHLGTGKVMMTEAYNLPAKYVIQTVGPIVDDLVTEIQKEELANCYKNSLEIAIQNNIRTVSFPCISTGVFRFPKDLASQIAVKTVDEFLSSNQGKIDKIIFNLWSDDDVITYEKIISLSRF